MSTQHADEKNPAYAGYGAVITRSEVWLVLDHPRQHLQTQADQLTLEHEVPRGVVLAPLLYGHQEVSA